MQKTALLNNLKKLPGVFWGLVILFIALSVFTGSFLSVSNLLNVLNQAAILLVVAIGVTMTILEGGIDLSVGGTMCLSGMAAAMVLRDVGSFPLALLAALGWAWWSGSSTASSLSGCVLRLSLSPSP